MDEQRLRVESEHWHGEECEYFEMALKLGHLTVIEGEVMITGKPPKDAEIGNVLTGEKYNPQDFVLNMAISFCPFCNKDLRVKARHIKP